MAPNYSATLDPRAGGEGARSPLPQEPKLTNLNQPLVLDPLYPIHVR